MEICIHQFADSMYLLWMYVDVDNIYDKYLDVNRA